MTLQRCYRCLLVLLFMFGTREALCTEHTWPLWNGFEPVADYAARVGLPPAISLRCVTGVDLEAVLVPAGKFKMGSSEPKQPQRTVMFGGMILRAG